MGFRDKVTVTLTCKCGNSASVSAKDTAYGTAPDEWDELPIPTSFKVVPLKRTSISTTPDFESAICRKCGGKANIDSQFG